MQISEVELFDMSGTQLAVTTASSPGTTPNVNQREAHAIDGALMLTSNCFELGAASPRPFAPFARVCADVCADGTRR
jgi:hypothetical protein